MRLLSQIRCSVIRSGAMEWVKAWVPGLLDGDTVVSNEGISEWVSEWV